MVNKTMPNGKSQLIIVILFIASLVHWYITNEPQLSSKMMAILVLLGIIAVFSAYKIFRRMIDIRNKKMVEDEFTIKNRVYAGYNAFRWSMLLWFMLFIANSTPLKVDEVLGVGLLSITAFYVLYLYKFKKHGYINENKN